MFERFTDRARRVVVLAQEEARGLDHNFIGTEHILLGLLAESDGVAARALRGIGIDLAMARVRVEEIIGRGQGVPRGHAPMTPRAKKVFEYSLREALELKHNYIGTEHLLLGLLREGEGVACTVLTQLGVSFDIARDAVIDILGGSRTKNGGWFGYARPSDSPDVTVEGQSGEPLCPVCQAKLIESASYRVLEVAEHGGEGHRRVLFLFCLRCGTAIDNEILPEDPAAG